MDATAARTYLATIEAIVTEAPVVVSAPALSGGKWSFVFALERAADGIRSLPTHPCPVLSYSI